MGYSPGDVDMKKLRENIELVNRSEAARAKALRQMKLKKRKPSTKRRRDALKTKRRGPDAL